MTFPRLFELVDLHRREREREMQEMAQAVNAAHHKDPARAIKRLSSESRRPITREDVPPWLRPVRKRGEHVG